MSYQALYRTWRPQRFDEIVGQTVITKTLKNALITNQISHAYLFTGPRGTGKTSAAKILAKAVNCPNLKDGEPCNKCDTCIAINKGALNDVIEIDAASNNGVEEIRNIRDKAKYAPTEAKYKVYIIDEVHMLSTGAFNALLKTLEEPPAHVIFILATTEPQKIPATIISRTQRFDFKRIKSDDILERMEYILDQKKIKYDEKALKVIAKSAEGGMRDALSILDQALSYNNDEVTYESALQVTGSVTRENIQEYVEDIIDQNVNKGLKIVQNVLDSGKDANQFIEDLIDYCQNVLLYHQDPNMVEKSELGLLGDKFKKIADSVDSELIYKFVETMNDVQTQLRFTNHPDVYLDILTVKLVNDGNKATTSDDNATNKEIESLKEQINDLKERIDNVPETLIGKPEPENKPVVKTPKSDKSGSQTKVEVDLEGINKILVKATRKDLTSYNSVWNELLQSLSVTQRALMHVSKPVAASEKGIVVAFDYGFLYQKAGSDKELMTTLENSLDRIVGFVPNIVFVSNDEWPSIRENYLKAHPVSNKTSEQDENDLDLKTAKKNDVVDKAKEMFGDDVIDVKDD